MRGEGAEALLDALFVADVGEELLVDGDAGSVGGRDVETAAGHQVQEADGLEGDRLAAGVGSGDEDGVESVGRAEGDVEGHGVGAEQRMARPPKRK